MNNQLQRAAAIVGAGMNKFGAVYLPPRPMYPACGEGGMEQVDYVEREIAETKRVYLVFVPAGRTAQRAKNPVGDA